MSTLVYKVDGEVSLAAKLVSDLWADCIFTSKEEEGRGGFSWWNRCFGGPTGWTLVGHLLKCHVAGA